MVPVTSKTQRTSRPRLPQMPTWGVQAFESHHTDDFLMEMWALPTLTLLYVLRGRGHYETPQASHALEAGAIVLVPIGQPYRLTDAPEAPMSLVVVCVDAHVWEADDQLANALPAGVLACDPTLQAEVSRLVRELLYEQTMRQPGWKATLQGLALRLLTTIVRCTPTDLDNAEDSNHPERRLRAYLAMLDKRFFEPADLESAALATQLSRRWFTDRFREITGTTWLDHLHRLRIDHARMLLEETDRTVTSIAFECGYDHLSTFYRAFKKRHAVSPEQWRQDRRSASHAIDDRV